jgi:hypothetical protein
LVFFRVDLSVRTSVFLEIFRSDTIVLATKGTKLCCGQTQHFKWRLSLIEPGRTAALSRRGNLASIDVAFRIDGDHV